MSLMTDTTPSLRPYLWMLLGSFAFAWMGVLAHAAGEAFDWQVIAMVRSVIPLLLVGTQAAAAGVKLVFWRPRDLWMRSIAGSVSLIGTFFALTRLPVADVFTLVNIFPLWVALLSWPLLGAAPTGQVWLSTVSGLIGVALIQQPHILEGNLAILIPLATSLSTALAMIGLHRLRGIDTRAVVVHFSMVSLAFSVAAYFLIGGDNTHAVPVSAVHILELLGVGLTATCGQLFLTKAYTHGHPANVSVVGLTQIVFALILDVLVLDHVPSPGKLLGVPLVLAPTAWLLLRRPSVAPELPPPEDDDGPDS